MGNSSLWNFICEVIVFEKDEGKESEGLSNKFCIYIIYPLCTGHLCVLWMELSCICLALTESSMVWVLLYAFLISKIHTANYTYCLNLMNERYWHIIVSLSLQLLLAYVSTMRYEGPEVDRASVDHDAKALYKAGEKKLGTDEKTFIRIFSERSRAHLAAVSSAYHSMYSRKLKKVSWLHLRNLFKFPIVVNQCIAIVTGCKKWNLWTLWVCSLDYFAMCWESSNILCKGTSYICLNSYQVIIMMTILPIILIYSWTHVSD